MGAQPNEVRTVLITDNDSVQHLVRLELLALTPGLQILADNRSTSGTPLDQQGTATFRLRCFAAPDADTATRMWEAENTADKTTDDVLPNTEPSLPRPLWLNLATHTPHKLTLSDPQLIPGLRIGLRRMHAGQTRTLLIPPPMAYANRSVGGHAIPAGSWLVFEATRVR